jgi:hypothetical protein
MMPATQLRNSGEKVLHCNLMPLPPHPTGDPMVFLPVRRYNHSNTDP